MRRSPRSWANRCAASAVTLPRVTKSFGTSWIRNCWERSLMDANERRRQAAADAADWWVRLQSADLSATQRGEFVDWLRESPVHVAEMLRIAQVHGALERFERWTRIAATPPAAERVA